MKKIHTFKVSDKISIIDFLTLCVDKETRQAMYYVSGCSPLGLTYDGINDDLIHSKVEDGLFIHMRDLQIVAVDDTNDGRVTILVTCDVVEWLETIFPIKFHKTIEAFNKLGLSIPDEKLLGVVNVLKELIRDK